ncbi:MAG TPA: hypothetical protein RMH99_33260 [Sandaracinaceae bacterium LLY-WYZ-13_1]|nr:hypothetical protein [Sandaracinaceae bacterium LLY-WYZ-13_1]
MTVVRRAFFGLDPELGADEAVAWVTRALEAVIEAPPPDVLVCATTDAETARVGRRWLCCETSAWREPMPAPEATCAALGRRSRRPTCAVMVDQLRRIVAFSAWLRWADTVRLASCGALLSGDVERLSVEVPQRAWSVHRLAALENRPPSRRSRTDQAVLDAAVDAGALGLRQWFPEAAAEPWAYLGVLDRAAGHRVAAEGRWLATPRPAEASPTAVELHAMRPHYRELAVPWDRRTWRRTIR